MAQFCPQCGAQLAPGQSFCPVCGASVAPQQPQPPQYQQAPPQYQQAPPQYQQPQYQQYQPVYGPAPVQSNIKNLWALITGGTVGFFCLLTLIFAIICMSSRRGFMDMHSIIGICLFFCGAGITVFFLAQRPLNAQLSSNEKAFSLAFMISNISAWLFVMIALIAVRAADILFIFAMLCFIAAGVFGYLSFKDLLTKTGKLTWGFMATLHTIILWFLFSIFVFAGSAGADLMAFVFLITAISLGTATAVFTTHSLKEPETKLF